MDSKLLAIKILETLEKEAFHEFYENEFLDYIQGDGEYAGMSRCAQSRREAEEKIINKIKTLFRL